MQVNTVKTSRTDNPAARRHGIDQWARRVLVGLALWWLALGACAQEWGLHLSDAPDGQAAIVVAVAPGSPAAAAGLRAGDRISQAQNFLVRNVQDFVNIVRLSEGRGSLLLRVSRDGWEKEVGLAASPAGRGSAAPVVPVTPAVPPRAWVGLQVADALPGAPGGGPTGVAVTGETWSLAGGWIHDIDPLTSGSQQATFANASYYVLGGKLNFSARNDRGKTHAGAGVSLPALPGRLDVYGQVSSARDLAGTSSTVGLYLPGLYEAADVDIFLEYQSRPRLGTGWAVLASRRVTEELSITGHWQWVNSRQTCGLGLSLRF